MKPAQKSPSFLTPQVADSTHSILVSCGCPKSDVCGQLLQQCMGSREPENSRIPVNPAATRRLTRVVSSGLTAQREVSENGDSAAPALNLTITSGKLHLVRPAAAPTL
jgi:hypothetical protein